MAYDATKEAGEMRYETFGPFPIELDEFGSIPNSMNSFWENVNFQEDGLRGARGCYVFGIKSSGGPLIRPWYVGRTHRQTFDAECFGNHQLKHYSRAMNRYKRATPFLYLVAQLTEQDRFYQGGDGKHIEFLETYLISIGLRANRELLNKRDTKLYREVVMPGFLNSPKGSPGIPAKELRRTFNFR